MAFVLPELPYAKDAFGDILSAETFDFHHGKHHNAYVTKANDQLAGAGLEGASLSEVIRKAKASGKASCSTLRRRSGTTASTGSASRPKRRPPAAS